MRRLTRSWPLILGIMVIAACAGRGTQTPAVDDHKTPAQLPTIHYTIQVGAFSTVERAARYADRRS